MSRDYKALTSLPEYHLCTLETLLNRQAASQGTVRVAKRHNPGEVVRSEEIDEWFPCSTPPTASKSRSGRYRFNTLGRIVLVTAEEREIVVCAVPKSLHQPTQKNEMIDDPIHSSDGLQEEDTKKEKESDETHYDVFAFDRNCYHVGYPMDHGDIEEIPVSCDGGASTTFHLTCITCPLHNRIFDLESGDMISIEHLTTSAAPSSSTAVARAAAAAAAAAAERNSSAAAGGVVIPDGKRKGGKPRTVGCHQRTHGVRLISQEGATTTSVGPAQQVIVVLDTFGHSNALSIQKQLLQQHTTSIPEEEANTTTSTDGAMVRAVETHVKLHSDRYNSEKAFTEFVEYDPVKGNSFVAAKRGSGSGGGGAVQPDAAISIVEPTTASGDRNGGEEGSSTSKGSVGKTEGGQKCCEVS